MASGFRTFAEMKSHILLNYPLFFGAIIATILSANSMKKAAGISKKYKVLYFVTIILLVLLFTLLFHWNFFAVVG